MTNPHHERELPTEKQLGILSDNWPDEDSVSPSEFLLLCAGMGLDAHKTRRYGNSALLRHLTPAELRDLML